MQNIIHSKVNKKTMLIMRMPIMMQKIKVIMNTVMTESTLVRKKDDGGVIIKGQGSADFDVKI